ncbi:helix-turn-helix domain-containing protein [Enterococcus hirae]|nr:helix-turn-helix domain-containing protein [Enterococcus hirae]
MEAILSFSKRIAYSSDSLDPQKRLVFLTVVTMLQQRIPVAEIAKENGLSRTTIYKIKKRII